MLIIADQPKNPNSMSKEDTYRLTVPYVTDPMQPFTQVNEVIELVKAHSGIVESSREGLVEDQRILRAAFSGRSEAESCREALRTVGFAVGIHNTAELDEPVDSADETGQFDDDCNDSGKADACQPVLDPLQRAEARYSDRDDDLDDDLNDDLHADLDDACRIATQEFADFILRNTPAIEWFGQNHQYACSMAQRHPALDAWHLAEIRFVEWLTHAVHKNGFANKPVDVWRAMHLIFDCGLGSKNSAE